MEHYPTSGIYYYYDESSAGRNLEAGSSRLPHLRQSPMADASVGGNEGRGVGALNATDGVGVVGQTQEEEIQTLIAEELAPRENSDQEEEFEKSDDLDDVFFEDASSSRKESSSSSTLSSSSSEIRNLDSNFLPLNEAKLQEYSRKFFEELEIEKISLQDFILIVELKIQTLVIKDSSENLKKIIRVRLKNG